MKFSAAKLAKFVIINQHSSDFLLIHATKTRTIALLTATALTIDKKGLIDDVADFIQHCHLFYSQLDCSHIQEVGHTEPVVIKKKNDSLFVLFHSMAQETVDSLLKIFPDHLSKLSTIMSHSLGIFPIPVFNNIDGTAVVVIAGMVPREPLADL